MVPFLSLFFLGGGRQKKVGTLILTSLLKNLGRVRRCRFWLVWLNNMVPWRTWWFNHPPVQSHRLSKGNLRKGPSGFGTFKWNIGQIKDSAFHEHVDSVSPQQLQAMVFVDRPFGAACREGSGGFQRVPWGYHQGLCYVRAYLFMVANLLTVRLCHVT